MDNNEQQASSSSSQQQNIDIQESDSNMNQSQQALFLDIKKSRSNDSFLGRLIGTAQQIQKRPLILNMQDFPPPKLTLNGQNLNLVGPPNLSIFKKIKKQKKHNKCDYQKNICGYITKKIIREFIGITFQDFVQKLCKKYYCDSEQARKFYLSKVEYITGPSHIPPLLKPEPHDTQQTICIKFAFRQFMQWFLKQRYLRYLLLEGKMTDKKAYIEYKNNVLFGFLQQDKELVDKLIQKLFDQKLEEEFRLQQQMHKIKSLTGRSRSQSKNIILTQKVQ